MKKNVTLKIGASALALVVGASGVWADYSTAFPNPNSVSYSTSSYAADGKGIENVVKVKGFFNGTETMDHAFANVDVVAPIYNLKVEKSPNKTTGAAAGEPITYTYTVTNNSNVTLDGVYLVDTHISVAGYDAKTEQTINVDQCIVDNTDAPGAVLVDSGTTENAEAYDIVNNLAPNATFECTYIYTVTQGDVDLLQVSQ